MFVNKVIGEDIYDEKHRRHETEYWGEFSFGHSAVY